jgi:hypothetical protein
VFPVFTVTVIVPVAKSHVGCTSVTVGFTGVAGCALIVTDAASEIHSVVFFTVHYMFQQQLLKGQLGICISRTTAMAAFPDVFGAVTVIVPVAKSHVGCN